MSLQQSQFSFRRSLRRLRSAFWRRRLVHWLVRTAWLTLLVPTVFMAGYLWWGWQVAWHYWLYPMLAIGLLSLLWAIRPLRLNRLVYRLDERLKLRTQLITAFEVSQAENVAATTENLVVQRLLQEAVNIIVSLRQRIGAVNRNLWLEIQTLIGVAVLLGAMLLLDALTPLAPNATPVELPTPLPEPVADEIIPPDAELFPPPFPPEMQAQMMSQEQLQQALQALADALRDQAVTRSVAEALDQGDLAGAAENLRRLADQLGDLSAEARAELGESLQEAADDIGGDAPPLTQPLEAGSEALKQDDLRQAGQALEDLAEALESIQDTPQEMAEAQPEEDGNSGEPQASESEPTQPQEETAQESAAETGAGAGEGEGEGSSQPTEEERLAVEGQPLELESDPELEERVLQPAELEAEAGDERTEDSPFARQSVNAANDLGPDPLTYPWEKREIIRRYFTP